MEENTVVKKKSHRKRKPKRPVPDPNSHDGLRLRAAKGEWDAAIRCLSGIGADTWTKERQQQIIDSCVKANAAKGAPRLIDELARHILEFDARILMRAEVAAEHALYCSDQHQSFMAMGTMSDAAVTHLDRVARLQDRMLQVGQVYARLRRMLALSEREGALGKNILRLVEGVTPKDNTAHGNNAGSAAQVG